jgi:hypothetical protein
VPLGKLEDARTVAEELKINKIIEDFSYYLVFDDGETVAEIFSEGLKMNTSIRGVDISGMAPE